MQPNSRAAKDGLWLFFALTFGLSWILWILCIAAGLSTDTPAGMLLFILGGCGPSIVGVVLLYRLVPPAGRKDFWKRVVNFRGNVILS